MKIGGGAKKGVIPIPQSIYSNQDWRYALGAISMNWELDKDQSYIIFWFIDKYDWHPEEARRTQCVHQAAENLKKEGAKEYKMIGAKAKIPIHVIMGTQIATGKSKEGNVSIPH